MNIDEEAERPINPVIDTGRFYKIVRQAVKDELQDRQRNTGRSIAQAIWHGITVAQAEIWKAMGWSK